MVQGVAGCTDQDGGNPSLAEPTLNIAAQAPTADDSAFYFYQGNKVLLEPAGDAVVVESDDDVPGPALIAALGDVGLTTTRIEPLPSQRRWLLRLATSDPVRQVRAAQILRGLANVGFAEPTYRVLGGNSPFSPVNRVSIEFRRETTPAQIDSVAKALGLTMIRPPRADSGFPDHTFRYPRGSALRPLAIAAVLDRHSLVKWASPDGYAGFHLFLVPPDPFYQFQFHLKNPISYNGIPVDINVEQAWNLTTGASTVRVGVIDDGVQANHPDMWTAFSTALGYDAFGGVDGNAFNPTPVDGHGTQVAGLIFAQHDNQGVSGIAPNTRARVARIFRRGIPATNAQIGQAINWAWQSSGGNSSVIKNSWGGGLPNNDITNAIAGAVTQGRGGLGTVMVFAAGNTGGPVEYPASLSTTYNGVIAVGAITRNGPRASYSSFGPGSQINLVAPSAAFGGPCVGEVVTTELLGWNGCNDGPAGSIDYTTSFSGTSAAAPQVAAVVALILSTQPNITATAMRTRLCLAAFPWGASNEYGCGKLDANKSVAPAPVVTISGPSSVRPGATCVWVANVTGWGPFSYVWSPGSSSTNELIYQNAGSNFTVAVTVTDAVGGQGSKSKSVTVSAGAPQCQF